MRATPTATSADPGLALAYRIASSVTWADIGARDGKTAKVAKRDAKRLARKTSAAARLKANASRGVVLQHPACHFHARQSGRYRRSSWGSGTPLTASWQGGRRHVGSVLREAAITSDGWCAAHHCFPSECSGRTHVHTVRCLNSLWDKVAAQAAARGMDTNSGVTAALEEWASESHPV